MKCKQHPDRISLPHQNTGYKKQEVSEVASNDGLWAMFGNLMCTKCDSLNTVTVDTGWSKTRCRREPHKEFHEIEKDGTCNFKENKMPEQEFICLECRQTGTYADLRKRFDSGKDTHCGEEVKDIEESKCKGCKCENDCERDYRADGCYT